MGTVAARSTDWLLAGHSRVVVPWPKLVDCLSISCNGSPVKALEKCPISIAAPKIRRTLVIKLS